MQTCGTRLEQVFLVLLVQVVVVLHLACRLFQRTSRVAPRIAVRCHGKCRSELSHRRYVGICFWRVSADNAGNLYLDGSFPASSRLPSICRHVDRFSCLYGMFFLVDLAKSRKKTQSWLILPTPRASYERTSSTSITSKTPTIGRARNRVATICGGCAAHHPLLRHRKHWSIVALPGQASPSWFEATAQGFDLGRLVSIF